MIYKKGFRGRLSTEERGKTRQNNSSETEREGATEPYVIDSRVIGKAGYYSARSEYTSSA